MNFSKTYSMTAREAQALRDERDSLIDTYSKLETERSPLVGAERGNITRQMTPIKEAIDGIEAQLKDAPPEPMEIDDAVHRYILGPIANRVKFSKRQVESRLEDYAAGTTDADLAESLLSTIRQYTENLAFDAKTYQIWMHLQHALNTTYNEWDGTDLALYDELIAKTERYLVKLEKKALREYPNSGDPISRVIADYEAHAVRRFGLEDDLTRSNVRSILEDARGARDRVVAWMHLTETA